MLPWLLPALILSLIHHVHFQCCITLLNQSFSKLSSCQIPSQSSTSLPLLERGIILLTVMLNASLA
jgi:hypothetical protein